MSRRTHALTALFRADPIIALHHVNAWEATNGIETDIVIDVCAYQDANFLNMMQVDTMRTIKLAPRCSLTRCVLGKVNVEGGLSLLKVEHASKAQTEVINKAFWVDFPAINEEMRQRENRYTYGVSALEASDIPFSCVAQFDNHERTTISFSEPGLFFNEPVFVSNPQGAEENDGVLLVVAGSERENHAVLLVLDAATMNELARAILPQNVGLGFHGCFVPAGEPE